MNSMQNLSLDSLAQMLVERAIKSGASSADVVVVSSRSTSVEVRNGEMESTDSADGFDIGLRVFHDQSQAIVSTTRSSDNDRDELAARAVEMARIAPPDPFAGLADSEQLASDIPDLDICDEADPSARDLLDMALAVEAAGLSVKGVSQSTGGSASANRYEIVLATSTGFCNRYARSGFGISAAMIAGEATGMERDYDYSSAVHLKDLEDAETVGRSAGERAVARLNPQKVSSQKLPVIFDRRVASSLLGHLSGAVIGSAIARGTSFLKDAMGSAVFAKGVNIIDDARMLRGVASKPFDGEGLATGRLDIVEDGVLNSWLLDCRSARQLGLQSNGHASRGTSSPPSASPTNLYLEAGKRSLEELLGDIGTGLLVTELIGMGVNPVTGDYSRGASGFWVENGELSYPVSEITIAGNLKDMFAELVPASDLEFRGSVNAPGCLVGEMMIAGT